jgi:hypothetical protein
MTGHRTAGPRTAGRPDPDVEAEWVDTGWWTQTATDGMVGVPAFPAAATTPDRWGAVRKPRLARRHLVDQQPGQLSRKDTAKKAGKVRYLGASSMYAWQFAKLQHAADLHGWTRFVAMQNQYNLLRRQDEPELLAMCADMAVGAVPYSPQGKGRLARPWGEHSHRSSVDQVVQAFDSPLDEPVVNAVQRIAQARDVSMAQVALAWVLQRPVVSAAIVGATKPHHLPDSIAALELHLTDDEIHALEEPYTPHGALLVLTNRPRRRPSAGHRRSPSPVRPAPRRVAGPRGRWHNRQMTDSVRDHLA